MIASPIHKIEIDSIQSLEEKEYLKLLLKSSKRDIKFDLPYIHNRAEILHEKGLGVADAAHVAFAEFAQADFISVDKDSFYDKLFKE